MYFKHFQLTRKPFGLTPGPDFFWFSEKHKEALATLRYGILGDLGFLLLTGEVGVGKTALIHRLLSSLDESTIVAHITDPGLTINDFFKLLAVEFGIDKPFNSKGDFLIILEEFLLQAYQDQKKVLLIVDEAQRVNSVLLDQIRVLSNIELNDHKLINIFFIGQPEFKNTLRTHRNRPIRQRIAVYYHVQPLDEFETGQYIEHRLEIAGAQREIFLPDAIHEIHRITKGYPRAINIICDLALLTGYSAGAQMIDSTIIRECENDLSIEEEPDFDFPESMISSTPPPSLSSSEPAASSSSSEPSPTSSAMHTTPPNLDALRFKYNPEQEPTFTNSSSQPSSSTDSDTLRFDFDPVPKQPPPPPQKSKFWYYPVVVAVSITLVAVAGYYFLGSGPNDAPPKQNATGPVNYRIQNKSEDKRTSPPPLPKSNSLPAQNDSGKETDNTWKREQPQAEPVAEAAERPPKTTKPNLTAPETATITVETAPVEEKSAMAEKPIKETPPSDKATATTALAETDRQDQTSDKPSVSDTKAVPPPIPASESTATVAPQSTQNEAVTSANESAGREQPLSPSSEQSFGKPEKPPSTPTVEDTAESDRATEDQARATSSQPLTPTASASAGAAIPPTAALRPQDTQSGSAVIEKPRPEIDDALEKRLRSFVQSYCNTYSAKDFNSFTGLFSPDALENGKPFKNQVPQYKRNFTFIDTIYYRIDVREMVREEDGETLKIDGRFFLRWLNPNKKWRENAGKISMRVKESESSFMITSLDYQRSNR